ncbi:MAG: M12 family metallo-peptidase, partial [Planctomycetota bacterium]
MRILAITIILSLFASFPALAEKSDFVSVEVAEHLRQELQLEDFSLWPLTLPEGIPDHFTLIVEHEGIPQILHLERYSVRASGFRSRAQQADGRIVEIAAPPARTYRGFIEGRPNSFVAASLLPRGLIVSIIEADKSIWHIEPMPEWGINGEDKIHVIYRQEDVIAGDWMCGSDTLMHPDEAERLPASDMAPGSALQEANCIKVCEIAFDADLEFYQKNSSSVPDTIADIESIVNSMDLIYARDTLIRYTVTDTLIRTAEPDPYSGTAAGDVLGEFRSEWNSNQTHITRDTAHLMTGKNLDGNIIGVAWVTVICNTSWAYGISQSRYTSNFSNRVALTAHEVGHNWSAGHCNADSDCSIMCSGLGGCSGNVSGFGSTAIEQITSYRSSRSCLQDGAGHGTPVPPKANLDKIVITNNETAVIDVLANDYDGNCDTLVIDDFQTVSNLGGTIERSVGTGPEGRDELLYTPPSYDFGEDSFTYTTGDGTGLQSTGTVKVNVRLPNTMQAYWKLDETSGSTASDSSGSGFDGTLEGTFTFDTASMGGKFGGALNFNGSDDHIDTGKTTFNLGLIGNVARTVTAWVYTRSFNDGGIYEMGRHSNGQDFSLRTKTDDNWWRVQYWGSSYDIDFSYDSKNKWVHFAHVHDGTRTRIYANTLLVVDVPKELNTADNKTFKIGRWDNHHFDGIIDDVRIYNYPLDIDAILAIIDGGRAENPHPFDSETDVSYSATLSWVPGAKALHQDVYFGTNRDAVANATTASPQYKGRQTETFYVPTLNKSTQYFWRVDQVTSGGGPGSPPSSPPPSAQMAGDSAEESDYSWQDTEAISTASTIAGNVWSFTTGQNMGTITREVWTGIGGDYVTNLTSHPPYPDSPNIREEINRLEGPVNWSDNYGTRIHGFLTPAETGSYTFWIASDDYSELWLSSNSDSTNQIKKAEVIGHTKPRQWDKYSGQQSSPVTLTASQPYYIKMLHKEGSGDDNLAVAWQGPNTPRQIILKLYLSPYDTDFPTPNPMTWATQTHPTSSTSISMTATQAS